MALSLDPATKVITIPQADLTFVSGTLYALDSNQFKKDVMALLASENYVWMDDAFIHNTEVTVAGTTFARTIEFINGYSITFEDTGSAYTVRIEGSNNNIFDVENGILNPTALVTVISTNSAGLIAAPEIVSGVETLQYDGIVHIDVNGGTAGTAFPIGTQTNPVNNLADALIIAASVGSDELHVIEDLTVGAAENIDGFTIYGAHASKSQITLTAGCSTALTQFYNCTLTGTASGSIIVRDSVVDDLFGFKGILHQTAISGTVRLVSDPQTSHILDCFSTVAGTGTPTLDFNSLDQPIGIRNYNGGIKLENKTGASSVSLDMNSGQVIIDGTCTNGTIVIRGIAKVTDNGTATVDTTTLAATPGDVLEQVIVGNQIGH